MIKHAIEAFSVFMKKFEPNTKYAPGNPFVELEKLPGIILEGPLIAEDRQMNYSKRPEFEFVKDGHMFIKRKGARHYNLDFTVTIVAARQEVLMRYIENLTSLIDSAVDLEFPQVEPEYSCYMRVIDSFSLGGAANDLSSICEAKVMVRIESVPLLSHIFEKVKAIETIKTEINIHKGGKETWVEDYQRSL